jgi:hypothetical protein
VLGVDETDAELIIEIETAAAVAACPRSGVVGWPRTG